MTDAIEVHDYPDRAALIGGMQPLLKAARRPLSPEWERFGLDRDGWRQLDLLAHRLVRHVYFEHLSRDDIRDKLHEAAQRYRALAPNPRPPGREFAADVLDAMAREPLRKTVYLGVKNLQLPNGTVVGDVRFVDPSTDAGLLEAFKRFGDAAPALLCELEVTAGTEHLLRDRACELAQTGLGLVRQQNLFGFISKIYLDQVLYQLDGTWTWRDGAVVARAGRWRAAPHPIPMHLSHPNAETWREELAELSDLYSAAAPDLRSRVDTCIAWLDVAASSDRWRIIIPAIFSGMEALLVPETVGLKAELVTVRSVAVHVCLDHEFFDPWEIMDAYRLRSDLIHGSPTPDVLNKDATDFAEFRRLWAFRVLRDYLELARTIGATDVRDVVSYLDQGKCNDVCTWLEAHGGSELVAEYRRIIPKPPSSAGVVDPTG